MAMVHTLLTEQLRPKEMKQMVLLKRIKDIFADGDLKQHYLLQSPTPGMGKCVCGDTLVKVRDKVSGEIYEMQISELFEPIPGE